MGGLLAAEVALMPPKDPNSGGQLRHRIVGTINFDTPFLGMHPGIVSSGIASLFRSTPPPPTQQTAHAGSSTDNISMMTPGTPSTMNGGSDYVSQAPSLSSASSIVGNDPNFNTPFPNDVHIVERKGFDKFMHFAKKHADDFTSASKQYFVSHIEFGGCMADFPGLKKRYKRIRELEDVDNMTEEAIEAEKRRVRFVNYYTASTGIPKSPKLKNISVKGSDGKMRPLEQNISELNLSGTKSGESERRSSGTPTPRISLEEHREGEVIPKPIDEPPEETETHLPDVKNRIENLGASSGVRRQSEDVSDTEMAPMRMVDAAPLMSDDDYPSGSEYHSAREDDDRRMSSEFTQPSLKPGPINFPMPTGLPPPPLLAKPELSPIAEKLPATPSAESQDAPKIITTAPTEPALPILPPEPIEPESFIPEDFPDKDSRKAAEKEHKRSVKTYQQALKDREKAIKEREKAIAKREKKAADEAEKLRKAEEKAKAKEEKERQKLHKSKPKTHDEMEKERLAAEKERMEAEGRRLRGEPEPESMSNTLTTSQNDGARSPSPTPSSNASSDPPHSSLIPPPPLIEPKKKKEHHFCLLPADLSRQRPKKVDPCWVRVYMEGVDEVGAHCGLFFQGPQYESLVGDVGDRIKGWIESEATRRVVEEFRWLD